MTNEERVKELLLALSGRDDETSGSMRARLGPMLTRLRSGEALGAAEQAWLDEEWQRSVNREGGVRLRRGQHFNETL